MRGTAVDPALVLDDDLEPATSARQHDRPVLPFTVENTHRVAVQEHRRAVPYLADSEQRRTLDVDVGPE
jgi:hypothetical protein